MSTPTPEQLGSLNAPQKRAVTYGEPLPGGKGFRAGPLLIVAGAGTGKTNTLAHRVAHLIVKGADPRRILLMTFARRMAAEMTRRVEHICALAFKGRPTVPADASGSPAGSGWRCSARRSLIAFSKSSIELNDW